MADFAELTVAQVRAIKSTILTEHFRFVPESFAKSCFDVANKCLYTASELLHDQLVQELRNPESGQTEEELVEQVQLGCYRLETLLEHEIDKKFDLFEIFVLRNTFKVDNALIPWIQLPHQVNFDPALKGSDQSTLDEYEQELKLYEEELLRNRRLKAVELFLKEKEIRLERIKEEIGWLGFGGDRNPLPQRTANLSPSLVALSKSLETLLATPSPASTLQSQSARRNRVHHRTGGEDPDEEMLGVWNHSRTSFINWVAGKQSSIASTPSAGKGRSQEGIPEGSEIGSKGDAKALLSRLNA